MFRQSITCCVTALLLITVTACSARISPSKTPTLVPSITVTPAFTLTSTETVAPTTTPSAAPTQIGNVDLGPESLGYQVLLNEPGVPPFYLLLGGDQVCGNRPNPDISWQSKSVEFNPDYVNAETGKGAKETFAQIL